MVGGVEDEGVNDKGSDSRDAVHINEDDMSPYILQLEQMREDTLKRVPSEELEPDFIPFWCPEDREELYREKITARLSPAVIDELSWLLLRNHIVFHFVSSSFFFLVSKLS